MLKKLTVAGLAAVVSGGVLPALPAHAGTNNSGDGGFLSGNPVVIPVSIPVDVCGNSVTLIGRGRARCRGGAAVVAMPHQHPWDS